MSKENEKNSGDQTEGKESNALDQDDISKLIDEMQGEENSSGSKDQAEKADDDEKKQDPDGTKDGKSESKESNDLNQDDISKLIDEVQGAENSSETEGQAEKTTNDKTKQEPDETKDDEIEDKEPSNLNQNDISMIIDEEQTEAKSSEVDEKKDTTEHVENDNEGEKSAEKDIPENENMKTPESNDDVKEKDIEERAESQKNDKKPVGEDEKSEKEIDAENKREDDDEDNGSFKGLDSDDEVEIDGDHSTEPDTEKKENDNDNKIRKNDADKESEKDDSSGQAAKLKEVKKSSKGKRFKFFVSCIFSVVFIAALFGAYTFFKKSGTGNINPEKPFQPEQIVKPEIKNNEELTTQQIKDDETKDTILSDSITAKIDEITELRDELLIKEREIADLIKNYKNGISEMEDEILRVKQNQQMDSFSAAIKNKKIEFGMMTIQRRLAYIEKIDPPYKWLNQGIEELLYLKRKIEIDSRVNRVISGIDMDKMIQEINIVTQSYRTGIENLKIDMKNVELTSFEMIWKRIIDKEKFAVVNTEKGDGPVGRNKPALANEDKNNRIIWEEICSGNFKRKNEMTELSTKAAKCLSKWKHADLFLNRVSELSPEVAEYLLKWKGNWICLNGVKKLSPEAAKHLFQWQGNLISLNGLSQISSGLLKHLPQWKGKQLELMGLKYKRSKVEQVGLKSLAKWEKLGGKLYIPVQIRKAINKS